MIKHAIKIKVSFDNEATRLLDSQSNISNWLRNHLLETANKLKEEFKNHGEKDIATTIYSQRGLRNLLPSLKGKYPFLKVVHSSPLKNKALELSRSIQEYQKSQKGKRKGKKSGWPRFHSQKKKWSSLFYDEPNKGFKVEGRSLSISLGQTAEGKRLKVLGQLDISPHKLQGERILNLRLKKEHGIFFAVFAVERKIPKKKPLKKAIAFDPNHKNLAYGVDTKGQAIELKNPEFLKSLERRIDKIKSRRDRCKRKSQLKTAESGKKYWLPSKRWKKFDQMLEELYRKRREQTKVYLYSFANALYKNYDLVSIGDYTPRGGGINKGMRRVMNNESLIGRFKEVLSWVALRSGKHYHEWNEYNSTKTCSSCKYVLTESLNPTIREWVCPVCEKTHIRDENAALNGLQKTINHMPCLGLREVIEVTSRRAWKHSGLGVVSIPGATIGISA